MRSRNVRRTLLVLMLCSVFVASSAGAKAPKAPDVDTQIDFGVKMAKRGLWNEALFRFRQASHLRVDDPKILNNVAVAYEATGQYDAALETYQKALQWDPENEMCLAGLAQLGTDEPGAKSGGLNRFLGRR